MIGVSEIEEASLRFEMNIEIAISCYKLAKKRALQ